MDSSKRVIYSPVKRAHQRPASVAAAAANADDETALKYVDEASTTSESEQHEFGAQRSDLAGITSSSISTSNGNRNQQRRRQDQEAAALASRGRKSNNTASFRRKHSIQIDLPIRRLNDHEDDDDDDDEELQHQTSDIQDEHYLDEQPDKQVEEVYLCSCCGTTKQLEPAMKYLPVFRSLFVLFNFLALVFGAANLLMGLWFRIDPKVYELHHYIETQNFTTAGWLMLGGGSLVAILALLVGCPASSRQSICLLVFYSIVMTLMSVVAIGTLVLLTVYGLGDALERFLTKEVYDQMRRRTMSNELEDPMGSSTAAQFIDFVQVKLRCCGAQDFRDYQRLGMVIPTTCYTIAANFIQAPGCGQALRELLDLRAGLSAGLAAGSVIAQLLATLLAGLMVCSIYNHRAKPRPASVASMGRSRSRSTSASRSVTPLGQHQQRPIRSYPAPAPGQLNSSAVSRPLSRASSIEV